MINRIKQATNFLKTNGYAVIPKFIKQDICQSAIDQINRLIQEFQPTEEQITVFGQGQHMHSKYFLDSADKVSFFYQRNALKDGKVIVPKKYAFNKIGHSLHQHNSIFKDITYTDGVWQICQQTNIKNPVVVQSMAILRPPNQGSRASIHQDSTYLYGQPDTLLGFWIPLQDVNASNGCLWGIPGSHKLPLYSRSKVINGVPSQQQYIKPEFDQKQFVPIEMQKGSLAIFTGRFVHKSHENLSQKCRYAYTWHLMDSSSVWSSENWLQREAFPKFPRKQQGI